MKFNYHCFRHQNILQPSLEESAISRNGEHNGKDVNVAKLMERHYLKTILPLRTIEGAATNENFRK